MKTVKVHQYRVKDPITGRRYWITAAATFVGVWGFCTLTYGFLGFALGWMPAAVLAVIFGMFWPLVVLLLMVAAAVILFFILRK